MPEAFLRIPAARIAVLIGPNGKTRKKIERSTKSKISIDSKSGEIIAKGENGDRLQRAENIVKAIGRGFAPGKALLLAGDDYSLSIIKLRDLFGKREKAIRTKKARIIGREGSTRNRIEKETGCFVSIYGNTVSLIGTFEEIGLGEMVINSILEGANIKTAFEMLKERQLEKRRFEL